MASKSTVDVALVPRDEVEPQGLAMIERLVRDPNVDPEKLDRMMGIWERAQAKQAQVAFDAAMAEAQQEIRAVAPDADNSQTHSKYATYAALDRALRPIYTKYGFGLSFGTKESPESTVRVCCTVSHRAGHRQEYDILMPADGKGARGNDVMTRTHATGSAVSYGMRYLLRMIFNVAIGDRQEDDDGNAAGQRTPEPKAAAPEPPGFPGWAEGMELKADEGTAALKAAWEQSDPTLRAFVAAQRALWWRQTKQRAEKADKAAR